MQNAREEKPFVKLSQAVRLCQQNGVIDKAIARKFILLQ
jgi:hypothetical protein